MEDQIKLIQDLVAEGDLKNALRKLRAITEDSESVKEIIIQSSKLSELERKVLQGTTHYIENNITRNQISEAILTILEEITKEESTYATIKKEINLTLKEIIRKHGIDEKTEKKVEKLKKSDQKLLLWIDDNPRNDDMEFKAIAAIGLDIITSTDPYNAYQQMKRKKPDIIVINSLERLKDNPNEGIEFCDYIYSKKEYQNIPVIIHSINLERKIRLKEIEQSELPRNIKNNFEKNTLIIKQLIEEIVENLDV